MFTLVIFNDYDNPKLYRTRTDSSVSLACSLIINKTGRAAYGQTITAAPIRLTAA